MRNYDFDNPEEFARLKKLAYNGQLDFNNFPAAEYRYFDRLQNIGYKVRCEGYPMDFAQKDCKDALDDYLRDVEEKQRCLDIYIEYNRARIEMGGLINKIYKARTPTEKLQYALMFVELAVDEKGLAGRNMGVLDLQALKGVEDNERP